MVIGGVFIQNTGRGYVNPQINIYDRDKETFNGSASLVVVDGRIVEVNIKDNGTGFLRIPDIQITDENGFGANLYPIMNVIPSDESKKERVAVIPEERIYCPAKGQINRYSSRDVTAEQLVNYRS